MALVIGRREVYALAKSGDSLQLTKMGDLPGPGVVCAASGRRGIVYCVPADAEETVMELNLQSGATRQLAKLPHAASKMFFYRNKIYCSLTQGTCIACVDPLNLSVDTLDTHHRVADFVPADHGFVFMDDFGTIYGYHFNYGSTKITETMHAQSLGHYKRFGVVLTALSDQKQCVATEQGQVVQTPPALANVTDPFIVVEDTVYVYSKTTGMIKTADDSYGCNAPPSLISDGLCILASVPELEDEDVCTLCFCEFEGDGDGITLDCGHRFHKDCVLEWVTRWDEFKAKGNHVVFTNAVCPGGCKNLVRHPVLGSLSESIRSMFYSVSAQSKKILRSMPATKLEEDLLFYVCFKCGKPFFGGEKVCFRSQGGEPRKDPSDLVCELCQDDFRCPTHGRELVVYKCSYCCNPASDRSFGNRYLCDRCSARWTTTQEPDSIPCPGDADCPLYGHQHRESSFPIGCAACLPPGAIDYDRIVPAPSTEAKVSEGFSNLGSAV